MTFVENTRKDRVKFIEAGNVDFSNDQIKKAMEVTVASLTSLDEVVGGNTEKIADIWLQTVQDVICFLFRNFGYLMAFTCNFQDVLVV